MALQNAASMSAWVHGAELPALPGVVTGLEGLPGLVAGAAGGAAAGPAFTGITTPRTFTLHDRQVYVTSNDINLYALCRKWVQNLPEEDVPIPEVNVINLAPLPPPDTSAQEEQPAPPTYSDPFTQQKYEAEEALRLMKAHWIAVRQHFQAEQATRAQRQQQRLLPWLSSGALNANNGMVGGLPLMDAGAQ